MLIQIKNRWSMNVIFECDAKSLKAAVVIAVKKKINLRGADLRSADLSGANLRSANLRSADLSGADLSGANLRSADLSGADLSGANLRSAYLSGANLRSAYLSGANLRSADLSGADLSGANLRSAYLSGAYLSGAYLDGEKITKQPLFILGLYWDVRITDSMIKIGCQHHNIDAWAAFSDKEINDMASNALDFWNKNKAAILGLANAHRVKAE